MISTRAHEYNCGSLALRVPRQIRNPLGSVIREMKDDLCSHNS